MKANYLLLLLVSVSIAGCKKETTQDNSTPVNYITLSYHITSDAGIVSFGSSYRTTAPNEPVHGVVDVSNNICSNGCGNDRQGTFQVISGHNYWFSVKTNYLAGGIQPHNTVVITYNGNTEADSFSGYNDCSINPGTLVYICYTVVGIAP